MDAKFVEVIAAVGSFCAVVLGGVLAWLLANERRIAHLEKGQERMEAALSEALQRIDSSLQSIHERLDSYFAGQNRGT